MTLDTDLYLAHRETWPEKGKHIMAQFDSDSIVLYQAYNETVADQLVQHQCFHRTDGCFSMSRMTWVKTNFLWMMFRSGWATKRNQERILAIRISRQGFDEILNKAVLSSHSERDSSNIQKASKEDEVRLQWDPDHLPSGQKIVERRAIQIGLRAQMLQRFSSEFTLSITDITEFVRSQYRNVSEQTNLVVPIERPYVPADQSLALKIGLSSI